MQKLFKCQTRYHKSVTADRTLPIARRSAQVGLATSKNQACGLDIGFSMTGGDWSVTSDWRCLPFLPRGAGGRTEPDWLSSAVCKAKEEKSRVEEGFLCLWRRRWLLAAFLVARSSWLRTNGKEVETMTGWLFSGTATPDRFCGYSWDTAK